MLCLNPSDFSVSWDGDGTLLVMVSKQHEGHVCGMCGDFDGDPGDDLRNKFGAITTDINALADSWKNDVCEQFVFLIIFVLFSVLWEKIALQ